MSEFFNKKQEVLEVKLTRFGRELFSRGRLSPKYYAFFDNDVLYDPKYVSGTTQDEIMGEFKNRIEDETPNLKIIPNLVSVENNTRTAIESQKLYSHLGTAKCGEQKYPAFRVTLLDGEISGSTEYTSGQFVSERIPVMNVNIQLDYTADFKLINEKSLLLKVEELNGVYEKENFELEITKIFEHISAHGPITSSIGLNFINTDMLESNNQISFYNNEPINGQQFVEGLPDVVPTNVEYYFTILTDYELDQIMNLEKLENNIYDIIDIESIKEIC